MSDYVTLHRATSITSACTPRDIVEVIAATLYRLEEDAGKLRVTPDWAATRIDLDFSEIEDRTFSQVSGRKTVGLAYLEITVRAEKEEE